MLDGASLLWFFIKRRFPFWAVMCSGIWLATPTAQAADFTPGSLVVVRIGDGSATLSSTSTPVFVDEYTTNGTYLQTIALPTNSSGQNVACTLAGTVTSEGSLKLSEDGNWLTLGGYASGVGIPSVSSSSAASVNRVVARIDTHGAVDTTTTLGGAFSGSNIRGAVSSDGTNIWASGTSSSTVGGIWHTTLGGKNLVQILSTPQNVRFVAIFSGQLYMSADSLPFVSISTVGFGEPTTLTTATSLPGLPTSGNHSPYDFWFKDASTLYIADDGIGSNGGGIQKWSYDGGSWSLQYILLNHLPIPGCRGLTGTTDQNSNAVLYATTIESFSNRLISVTDTGSNSTAAVVALAGTNTYFRGVAFSPATAMTNIPLLSIQETGGVVIVSWPSPSSGWILQTNSTLLSSNWFSSTLPVNDNGTNRSVQTTPIGNQFFRLKY
jgi:hypothetical protein